MNQVWMYYPFFMFMASTWILMKMSKKQLNLFQAVYLRINLKTEWIIVINTSLPLMVKMPKTLMMPSIWNQRAMAIVFMFILPMSRTMYQRAVSLIKVHSNVLHLFIQWTVLSQCYLKNYQMVFVHCIQTSIVWQ